MTTTFHQFQHVQVRALPLGPVGAPLHLDADGRVTVPCVYLGLHAPGWAIVAPRFAENLGLISEIQRFDALTPA